MDCKQAKEELSAYMDGELAPASAEALAEHLTQCDSCRAELAELQGLVRILHGLPQTGAPAELRTRIMEQVRSASGSRIFSLARFAPRLAAVAAMLLAVAALVLSLANSQFVRRPPSIALKRDMHSVVEHVADARTEDKDEKAHMDQALGITPEDGTVSRSRGGGKWRFSSVPAPSELEERKGNEPSPGRAPKKAVLSAGAALPLKQNGGYRGVEAAPTAAAAVKKQAAAAKSCALTYVLPAENPGQSTKALLAMLERAQIGVMHVYESKSKELLVLDLDVESGRDGLVAQIFLGLKAKRLYLSDRIPEVKDAPPTSKGLEEVRRTAALHDIGAGVKNGTSRPADNTQKRPHSKSKRQSHRYLVLIYRSTVDSEPAAPSRRN